MRRILLWTLAISGLGAAPACTSEPLVRRDAGGEGGSSGLGESDGASGEDGVNGSCAAFASKIAACGLIDGARLAGCTNDDPLLPCATACVTQAECAELGARYCDDAVNAVAACLEACQAALPPPEFICDDGMAIAASWRCDGAEDCAGGEDERCPAGVFTCRNGLNVPAGWQCDGFEDCADGEDELDCPNGPMISCEDGTRVSARRDCDGVADCAGGEDERGCARLVCP